MKLNPYFFRYVLSGFGDAAKVLFGIAVVFTFGAILVGFARELWLAFPDAVLLLIEIAAGAVILTFAMAAIGAWMDGHRPFKDSP